MARQHSGSLGAPRGRREASLEAARRGRPTVFDRWLVRRMHDIAGRPALGLALWDDVDSVSGLEEAASRVRIEDRRALWRLALRPQLEFGELYASGRIEVEGDLAGAVQTLYRAAAKSRRGNRLRDRVRRAWPAPASSPSRSRRNVHHHYDLGNEFYRLWLDREAMQYTCAYYPQPGMALEAAQRAKMDHVCRKLWLRGNETVVEAGCGWGGFALHMARCYGVRVRAFNLSREQIAYAREWAAREGLEGRVEFVEDDYRNIDGTYDVFVSVGMLEHVGRGNYRELGRVIDRCLAPRGRGLIHSIGRDRPSPLNPWIRRRIFPGGYPPTLREMMRVIEPAGFSVLDVENLRLHYAQTLRAWLERFEGNAGQVRRLFDERFVRTWRLYLAGSIAAFATGSLQLFQVLFARSGSNNVPWSRAEVYGADPAAGGRP